jgi:hypothetical protein
LLLDQDAARKDSAVHVSLSSYSPVKQPGTGRFRIPVNREASKLSAPIKIGSLFTVISEELRRRAITP